MLLMVTLLLVMLLLVMLLPTSDTTETSYAAGVYATTGTLLIATLLVTILPLSMPLVSTLLGLKTQSTSG